MIKTQINAPRLLLEADLTPVQGTRFQPTGFPDIGAAEFTAADGKSHLLVESAQSMANRLEAVIWDEGNNDVVGPLKGMPYVKTNDSKLGETNSLLEAHRLNSPYIVGKLEKQLVAALDWNQKIRPDLPALARYLLKYDPNSLIHGIFFSNIKPGTLRLPRLLSAFIEAEGVSQVATGGVKFDRLDAQGSAKEGKGHVPFQRMEYTAEKVTAYFNFDLYKLRSYGLSDTANNFLQTLALYKIRRFLDLDLRLRTACDFEVRAVRSKRPDDFTLPSENELAEELRGLAASLTQAGEFNSPAVREV